MDMTATLAPKSDQMNADDLISGPRTFTITDVREGTGESPVNVYLAEFPTGRPYKPCLSMRRVMVAGWGKESDEYVGKRFTLYRDPGVRFGGQDIGGIRISHMSDIPDRGLKIALTVTKGKRAPYSVVPLSAAAPTSAPVAEGTVARIAELRAEWPDADEARREVIKAEVAALEAGQ